jgi:SAM-dependent methyltransferase
VGARKTDPMAAATRRSAPAHRRGPYRGAVAPGTEWEDEAENWIRWARTEGHDAYWAYRASFFDRIVPAAGAVTVELGCGEGRVARDLRDRAHHLIGVELSPTLVAEAAAADPGGRYVRADASRLPLAAGCCDLVVAYNSLMDIADMEAAVAEAGRILIPGGRFCVCVTHPINEAGRFDSRAADAPFVITDTYFGRRRFEATEARGGLTMTFRGWSYALEEYAQAFERAGFLIERMAEPRPDGSIADLERWHRVPLFLHIRAVRP